MTAEQKAARVIRSLLRELRLSDHIVYPEGHPPIAASKLLQELEAPKDG